MIKRADLKSKFHKKYQVVVEKRILLGIWKATEEPAKSEPYVIINGTKPYSKQIKALAKFLKI